MSIRNLIAKRPWILAVGVSALVVGWLVSGNFGERDSRAKMPGSESVGTAEGLASVQIDLQMAEPITRMISVYGQTEPARTVEMSAETEGRVEIIGAVRGRRIKAGEIILQLDTRDRQARLAQAKASVREARTSYEAQLQLQQEGYVSETQIAEAISKLEGAKAELTRAQLDLDYMVIRAPFDGTLQDRDVEIGDFVRVGDQVATFVDNTHIIVTGTVAEQDAGFVKLGATGRAKLATGQNISGHIRYLSPVADASTRTFNVELEVPNPDGTLLSGVTAEMQLPGGQAMAHRVSPALLTLGPDGDIGLKIVDEFNRVELYPVELAMSRLDGVWVTGLPETARIITVGQGYVAPGQVVEAVTGQPETALAGSEADNDMEQMK